MTHEELLAKIDYELKAAEFEDICGDGGHPPTHKALRAVVELHKPIKEMTGWGTHTEPRYKIICSDCQLDEYPCPTIQKITEELK